MAKDPRWLALIVLCAGTLVIILDGTIVTVALPSIQRDLGFSQSGLAWVVNAYLIAFAGFAWRQATAARPLLPLRIFRSRDVTGANVVQALLVADMLGFQFILPLYLRRVLGYGPAETGLAFLPITVVIAGVSLAAAPRLITRFGARTMLLVSLPLLAIGLALLSQTSGPERYATGLMPLLALLGLGAGLALPAVTTLVMSAVTPEDSGVASGLANTTQQAGGATGVAVAATLATWRTGALLAGGHSATPALAAGYHLAFGAGAGLIAAAIAVAAAVLTPRRRPRVLPPTPRTPAGRATAQAPCGQASPR